MTQKTKFLIIQKCFVCFFLKVIASVLNTNNSKKNQIIMTKYQFLLKKKKAENWAFSSTISSYPSSTPSGWTSTPTIWSIRGWITSNFLMTKNVARQQLAVPYHLWISKLGDVPDFWNGYIRFFPYLCTRFWKRKPIKAYDVSRSLEACFRKRKPIKEKKQKKITKKSPVLSHTLN